MRGFLKLANKVLLGAFVGVGAATSAITVFGAVALHFLTIAFAFWVGSDLSFPWDFVPAAITSPLPIVAELFWFGWAWLNPTGFGHFYIVCTIGYLIAAACAMIFGTVLSFQQAPTRPAHGEQQSAASS